MDYADKIKKTFNDFDGRNSEVLNGFYEENVIFIDPVLRVQGLDSLKKYYFHTYSNVRSIRFEFGEMIVEKNRINAPWTMELAVKGLNRGDPFKVQGCSNFEFNGEGKVIFHRDYVDLGAMVYERLPLQGKVISLIKRMLRHGVGEPS
jgi:hypothetical protein